VSSPRHSFRSKPSSRLQVFAAKLRRLLKLAWRKICPWDPGDFPELDAFDAPPHRPPAVPRHQFGRRTAWDDLDEVAPGSPGVPKIIILAPPPADLAHAGKRR
jgi:hypothetical protein